MARILLVMAGLLEVGQTNDRGCSAVLGPPLASALTLAAMAGYAARTGNTIRSREAAIINGMPQHYATATIARLVEAADKVQETRDRTTLLRVVNG